ncbi:MAG TPA: hypothetical protein VJS12_02800 [Steroidobacteraceae bacterium]|nr:hypothetical protein [Steroidobacteraceae bacterium]
MFERLLVAIGLAALSGCGTLQNRNGAEMLTAADVTGDAAFVVLSAGAPEKCFATSTFLKLKAATEPYGGKDIALLSVDGYSVKSDFADHHGNLHAVKLAPGQYYVAAWIANPYVTAVRVKKAEFTVGAGEVVYLGEYFMPVSCVWNPSVEWRDQQERDLKLLALKNPALAGRTITKRIAAFTGYAVGAAE